MAAAVLTVAAISPAAGQINQYSVPMDEVDGSGVDGGAQIRGVDEGLEVTVFISEGDTDGVHPVHIHEGTCDDLGDVAYALEDIVDGESVTVLEDLTFADVMTGEYAINAHLSEDEMDTYVMCGNIPEVEGLADDDDDAVDDEDDAVTDDEDDDMVDDEDDAVTDDDDDAVTDDEDDAVTDDEDDAVVDDEDDDMVDDEDDAVVDDEEEDDTEDLVPATGGEGVGAGSAMILMTVLGGAALGTGLLVRRRFAQV